MYVKNQRKILEFWVGIIFCLLFLLPVSTLAQTDVAGEIFQLVNEERINHNLSPLTINQSLQQAADNRAVDMINKNYFSHRSPDGRLPWDFILEQGYDYLLLGENLAMDWPTPNDAVTAWMQSPTHKRNIVSYEFTETGIAAVAYKNSYLIVQIFGQESDIMISSEQNVINAEKQSNPVIQKSEQHLLPSFIETDNLNNQSTFATNIISNKENSENMSVLGASNWSTANVNPANKNPNFLLPFLVFSFFPISMALYLKVQAVHEII